MLQLLVSSICVSYVLGFLGASRGVRRISAAPKATTPKISVPNQIHVAGPAVKRDRYGSVTSSTKSINASDVMVKFRIGIGRFSRATSSAITAKESKKQLYSCASSGGIFQGHRAATV